MQTRFWYLIIAISILIFLIPYLDTQFTHLIHTHYHTNLCLIITNSDCNICLFNSIPKYDPQEGRVHVDPILFLGRGQQTRFWYLTITISILIFVILYLDTQLTHLIHTLPHTPHTHAHTPHTHTLPHKFMLDYNRFRL